MTNLYQKNPNLHENITINASWTHFEPPDKHTWVSWPCLLSLYAIRAFLTWRLFAKWRLVMSPFYLTNSQFKWKMLIFILKFSSRLGNAIFENVCWPFFNMPFTWDLVALCFFPWVFVLKHFEDETERDLDISWEISLVLSIPLRNIPP